MGNFKFGYPRLTLKGKPKVKSDYDGRLAVCDFPQVCLPSQTSRTNNKRVISTFKFDYPRFTLKEGPRSNATTPKYSQPTISCTLV